MSRSANAWRRDHPARWNQRAGRADAFASTRQFLVRISTNLPGSRVLEDRYGANLNRVVVPKGHAGRLAYVTVRELSHDTQALMLIGHIRGTSAIASVLAEMLKAMIRDVAA